jgi:putative aldouronate transport system permease protein
MLDAPKRTLGGLRHRYLGSEIIFTTVIALCVILCIVPILHVVALSLSGRQPVQARTVIIWPKDLDLNAYRSVFGDKAMQNSLVYSLLLTLGYTVLSMVFSVLLAYPLSKIHLPGRKGLMIFILIPMYFTGGTIPQYLWVKQLGILDTPWSLIWPVLISTYNVIILRNFFSSIPVSLEESAYLDGCNDFQILWKIVLPLSTAALATISLFYAVSRWNNISDVRYYINKYPKYYTLQLRLYQMIFANDINTEVSMLEGGKNAVLSDQIKTTAIVFSTVPILMVYPFLQRYFVQGVMIGAIKE